MMRTGAPLEYAPMTPRMPFDIATSMEPASSGVNVEAPPSVYNTSISSPASLKKPCFSAMSTMVLSQKPRCATATFRVSASALDQIDAVARPSSSANILCMLLSKIRSNLSSRTALLQPVGLETRLGRWAGEECEKRPRRLLRGVLGDRAGVAVHIGDLGRQGADHARALHCDELAGEGDADLGIAAKEGQRAVAAGLAQKELRLDLIVEAHALQQIGEIDAGRAAVRRIVGGDRAGVLQHPLEVFDRGDVRHHHAVAHCDAAGGTAEVGAAAGVEAAFLFERFDHRKRQDDHVGLFALDETLPVRADGVKRELDFVAARAGELRSELAHRPFDRAGAHHFDLGHFNSSRLAAADRSLLRGGLGT